MAKTTLYRYKIVISSEDELALSTEFETSTELTEYDQMETAKGILFAVKDAVEAGRAKRELQPVTPRQVEEITYTTTWES